MGRKIRQSIQMENDERVEGDRDLSKKGVLENKENMKEQGTEISGGGHSREKTEWRKNAQR